MAFHFEFEWDPRKAELNRLKHGVMFAEAGTVIQDPLARSRRDEEHSEQEERWILLGRSSSGRLLLVVHTYTGEEDRAIIRLISARMASPAERRQYEQI